MKPGRIERRMWAAGVLLVTAAFFGACSSAKSSDACGRGQESLDGNSRCDAGHPPADAGTVPLDGALAADGPVDGAPPTDLAMDAVDTALAVDAPPDRPAEPDAADARTCAGPGRAWHYAAAGCGASAPTPTCGGATEDACLRGYFCTCDGVLIGECDGWNPKPWGWFTPLTLENYNAGGQRCDPNHPPARDGG